MKKRLLTLVLTVCLLAAAALGTATTATAATGDTVAGYLVKYAMKAGDTVDALCVARDLDPNTERDKIAKINNITNFNWMMPGTVLWLPSKTATTDAPYYTLLAVTLEAGDTPAGLCQEYGVDYNGKYNILTALNSNVINFMPGQRFVLPLYVDPTGPVITPTPTPAAGGGDATPTPVPTATPVPAVAGDTVKFYLAQHVLQAGETVSGVCAAMGIDFANQAEWIRGINGILDWNFLMPGRVILLPVATKPTSGSYYQIMAHTVVPGDRVYNLCLSYGLNYYTYEAMLQRLNNRNNLATFYPGETVYLPMYVPAATTAAAPAPAAGAVTPTPVPTATPEAGGGGGGGGGTETPTPVPTASPTPSPAPGAGIPAADTLAYLIIPHSLQAGETVSGVCADMGVDFMANYDRIMQLSNITDYNYLMPNKLILIPSTTYPASGPYYKIMAHTLVAGDTVYDLCLKYGLNYTNNAAFLQRLNNRDNLATYYVGQTVYMPLYVAG